MIRCMDVPAYKKSNGKIIKVPLPFIPRFFIGDKCNGHYKGTNRECIYLLVKNLMGVEEGNFSLSSLVFRLPATAMFGGMFDKCSVIITIIIC